MAHDTSPAGIAAGNKRDAAKLADAKAGSALGTSGTYQDVANTASPDESTIANNSFNSHPAAPKPPGSTSDV